MSGKFNCKPTKYCETNVSWRLFIYGLRIYFVAIPLTSNGLISLCFLSHYCRQSLRTYLWPQSLGIDSVFVCCLEVIGVRRFGNSAWWFGNSKKTLPYTMHWSAEKGRKKPRSFLATQATRDYITKSHGTLCLHWREEKKA